MMYERSHYHVEGKSGNQPTLAERSCWMVSCWPTSKSAKSTVDELVSISTVGKPQPNNHGWTLCWVIFVVSLVFDKRVILQQLFLAQASRVIHSARFCLPWPMIHLSCTALRIQETRWSKDSGKLQWLMVSIWARYCFSENSMAYSENPVQSVSSCFLKLQPPKLTLAVQVLEWWEEKTTHKIISHQVLVDILDFERVMWEIPAIYRKKMSAQTSCTKMNPSILSQRKSKCIEANSLGGAQSISWAMTSIQCNFGANNRKKPCDLSANLSWILVFGLRLSHSQAGCFFSHHKMYGEWLHQRPNLRWDPFTHLPRPDEGPRATPNRHITVDTAFFNCSKKVMLNTIR